MPNFKLTITQNVRREIDVTIFDVATEQEACDAFMTAFENGQWGEDNANWYVMDEEWPDVQKVEVVG